MSDPIDRPEDAPAPVPADAARTGRRRFLQRAGALVAAAPLAATLAAVAASDAAAATKAPARRTTRPAPKPSADPYAAARPDLSLCRTAEERATLERQWKGALDLVKVLRDTPLDPATEPVTVFAALPRSAARSRGDVPATRDARED